MSGAVRDPQHILIVKPSSLGDVVHTLPAVALIKRRWPNARLSWLVNPEWAPLLDRNPYVDEAVIFPRRDFRGIRGALKIPGWAAALGRRLQADLVLDFQCLLRSALISSRCRARGGTIVGLSDGREGSRFFYDCVVDVHGKAHAVDRYLSLVESLGIAVDRTNLEWPLPSGPQPEASIPEKFILLHPFSRGTGKSLTVPQVIEFCRAAEPHGVVIAGRSEEEIPELGNVTNLLNRTTLAELIWLLRNAAFVVSVDSGPMHIAAALTLRLVAIHTWSDPLKVGPYRSDALVWKEARISTVAQIRASQKGEPMAGVADLGKWVGDHAT